MTTSVFITTTQALTPTKAPQLPAAPVEYDRTYQDALTNILRQYFNTVDSFVSNFALGGVYAFANLPDPVDAGMGARAFVTDAAVATFNTTVTGGGTNKVPVFSNGTVWKVG